MTWGRKRGQPESLSEIEFLGRGIYTHIETEGTLSGFPLELARDLRSTRARRLIVAGGIRSLEEVDALEAMGVDAVVGMAIYTGAISQ